ncbi:MAG: PD-(D/E)XK nuclease family protein [Anaerolineales bacterium]
MSLPPDFLFSQSNLQDFVDCPRRFELRYILKQPWPALQPEPVLEWEQSLLQGLRFHQLILQYLIGMPAEILTQTIYDHKLQRWWDNFLTDDPLGELPSERYPEFTLSSPFAGFRLIAKYDLIAVDPGKRIVIVDWKTASPRTNPNSLRERIQSRLYPLLVVKAGHHINREVVNPEQVEMIYWFAEKPSAPFCIQYNQTEYLKDSEYITRLITKIASLQLGKFELTLDDRRCAFCNYQTLCNRGKQPGNLEDLEEESYQELEDKIQIDIDQIGAIQF